MGDEELYLKATNEVEGASKDPALWAKAMALADGDQDKAKYQYIKLRVEQLAKSKPDVQKEYGVHEAKAEAVEQVADIDNASGISGSEVSKEDARKHDPSASETPKDAVSAVAAYDLQTVRKKAEAGDAAALYTLGVMYADGWVDFLLEYMPVSEFSRLEFIPEKEVIDGIRDGIYVGQIKDNEWFIRRDKRNHQSAITHGRFPRKPDWKEQPQHGKIDPDKASQFVGCWSSSA
jgi:TPR repeat protein